ncbi:hypothetical protein N0V83_002518 [Neocucurbitaria cava]|uniref:Dienelactone hydrolase domain-containing protein n=1 Tax=Neocucurbitaria cava TaxID=798079 RepID=A0A9W8YCD0_9PLEO|nr:hypothetical protein N0V83_002518 [Neocucurbitaria cava]
MADRKRLLGVVVPTKQNTATTTTEATAIPTTTATATTPIQTPDAAVALVVPPPPLTAERRAQIDSGGLTDYDAMAEDELIAIMREKKVSLRGRPKKAHKVKFLRGPDDKDVAEYQAWKDLVDRELKIKNGEIKPEDDKATPPKKGEERSDPYRERHKQLVQRQGLMFASKHQADPTRRSFLDLPPNVRTMIYDLALFRDLVPFPWGRDFSHVKAYYDHTKDRLRATFAGHCSHCSSPCSLGPSIMFSVLNMMGAMNKQIRNEVRCHWYSKINLRIMGPLRHNADIDPHTLVQRVLEKIGNEGRTCLTNLYTPEVWLPDGNAPLSSYDTFYALLNTMQLCQKLRYFDLTLAISHFFYPCVNELDNYFSLQEPLVSPCLERFATFLSSMPNARGVDLVMRRELRHKGSLKDWSDDDKMRRFAFTGKREMLLWQEVADRLQANFRSYPEKHNGAETRKFKGKTFISIHLPRRFPDFKDGDKYLDFPTWLDWHDKKYPASLEAEIFLEDYNTMLIQETHKDVPTQAGGDMRIFIFHPTIANYPKAKFPGVVVFSEIYQVTGPVARFARQIASQGYIVAAPSSYHEFTGPEPLAYDGPGTDAGNEWKITKKVEAYDEDARLSVDALLELPTCNGRVGATGMCLGGHLAYRCALDPRVVSAICYFATDIHSRSLGAGKNDDSLARAKDIKGELVMIFGKMDNHVPPQGRDLIRKTLHEAGVTFSFYEPAWAQHAFIRDESSKGRYDAALTGICFEMLKELFNRTLRSDLGPRAGGEIEVEDVC